MRRNKILGDFEHALLTFDTCCQSRASIVACLPDDEDPPAFKLDFWHLHENHLPQEEESALLRGQRGRHRRDYGLDGRGLEARAVPSASGAGESLEGDVLSIGAVRRDLDGPLARSARGAATARPKRLPRPPRWPRASPRPVECKRAPSFTAQQRPAYGRQGRRHGRGAGTAATRASRWRRSSTRFSPRRRGRTTTSLSRAHSPSKTRCSERLRSRSRTSRAGSRSGW